MRRASLLSLLLPPCLMAQQPATPALPHSPLLWDVREGSHPRMGPITVAVPEQSVVTAVGKEKILSLVFFSCEKIAGRIAIELANAAESDARSGLYPKQMPKMLCSPRSSAPRSEIPTTWYVSEIGDALARGLVPSDLRRCASIEIQQEIALPRGWGPETQRVDIEVIPYKKELDTVLAACAVPQPQLRTQAAASPQAAALPSQAPVPAAAAKLPATPAPNVAAAGPPRIAAAPPAPANAPATSDAPWRSVRVIATGGRTNVRESPRIDAPVVIALEPGSVVLVQPTGSDWWRVRPARGNGFAGYIRQDRLLLQ